MANSNFTVDAVGNLHDKADGRFSEKTHSAPTAVLDRELVRDADAMIRKTAAGVARSYHLDASTADDIAQDTWAQVQQGTRDAAEVLTQPLLLKAIARKAATRYTAGYQFGLRHEDFAGRRALAEREAAFEREHGVPMTKAQREQAADEVRLSFPAGRRPKPDFFREFGNLSIDRAQESGIELVAPEHDDIAFTDVEDEAAAQLHRFENTDGVGKVEVRRDSWRIVTISSGAPQVARDSMSWHVAKKHRDFVAAAGRSVHSMAVRYIDGEASAEEEEAVFAPFGAVGREQKLAVAEVLESHPKYADHLWREALKGATR